MPDSDTVTMLMKVLADTTDASVSFSSLGKDIGGLGAAGGGILQLSADIETSMARISTAYNNADFSRGTSKYEAAKAQIAEFSTTLATPFEGVAEVYNQAARFVDEFGNKLPIDKVNEYTDTVLRLSKISSDAMNPTTVGQDLDVFEKLFNKQNFGPTGAAMADLSKMHNLGEEPVWQAAIGIAQSGAELGVNQAEALGLANYLVDRGQGGRAGGSSIGRMLLRMDTSADEVLDPNTKYSKVKTNREAQEKLDDLQTSLKQEELKQQEMYGQHGLKKQYKQHPEEVIAAQDRIAKLHREIADSQEDIAHENDPNRTARGQMNMTSMAQTAGMDATDYANLFKESPVDALTGAQGQLDNPTELTSQSNTMLGTSSAHLSDAAQMARWGLDKLGQGPLHQVDVGVQAGTKDLHDVVESSDWEKLRKMIQENSANFEKLNGVLSTLGPVISGAELMIGAALPGILKNVFTKGPVAPGGPPVEGLPAAGGGGAAATALELLGGLGPGAGLALIDFQRASTTVDAVNDARQAAGLPPIQMHIGNLQVGSSNSGQEVWDAFKAQFIASFDAAMSGHVVEGGLGGNQ